MEREMPTRADEIIGMVKWFVLHVAIWAKIR